MPRQPDVAAQDHASDGVLQRQGPDCLARDTNATVLLCRCKAPKVDGRIQAKSLLSFFSCSPQTSKEGKPQQLSSPRRGAKALERALRMYSEKRPDFSLIIGEQSDCTARACCVGKPAIGALSCRLLVLYAATQARHNSRWSMVLAHERGKRSPLRLTFGLPEAAALHVLPHAVQGLVHQLTGQSAEQLVPAGHCIA